MHNVGRFISEEQPLWPEKPEVFRLRCNNGKIKRLAGYQPQRDIREGLARTVVWFSDPANPMKYESDVYHV